MDPILFNICFCQKILHVVSLDLLKLISRKAWLMLAAKINKQNKDHLLSLCLASPQSVHHILKIAKFSFS